MNCLERLDMAVEVSWDCVTGHMGLVHGFKSVPISEL